MKNIEILVSDKLIPYESALKFMEERINHVKEKKSKELIWFLEHPSIYTSGRGNYVDVKYINNIPVYNTGRGGKITWHGPGQKIFYFVIDLSKRDKDIRKFVNIIENIILDSLKEYKINAFADRKNVGIWVKKKNKIIKLAAIGIKVKKWVAYHGFSINMDNNLQNYKKIIPCGIRNRGVTNLLEIKKQNFKNFEKIIIKNFLRYLKS